MNVQSKTPKRYARLDRLIPTVAIMVYLSMGCEQTRIFAEPENLQTTNISTSQPLESVGTCTTDDECPQWSCVTSRCIDNLCVPVRGSTEIKAQDLSSLEGDQRYVSISLSDSDLIALSGDVSVTLDERSLPNHANSLGSGDELQRWIWDDRAESWESAGVWRPDLELSSLRAITIHEDEVWLHGGDQLRELWRGSWEQTSGGQYERLSAPLQALTFDENEIWASVFDKGLERLTRTSESDEPDDDDESSFEANVRFNTPGRALNSSAGRSFIIVADGYAGLSLFEKRADSALGNINPARRLVTPPQELSSEGRVVDLDLIEDRVLSAELGAGVGLTQVTTEGGLVRRSITDFGGEVRWVSWVDPYTALVWVSGRGLLALDFLTMDQRPKLLVEIEMISPTIEVTRWSADRGRIALLSEDGELLTAHLLCTSQ